MVLVLHAQYKTDMDTTILTQSLDLYLPMCSIDLPANFDPELETFYLVVAMMSESYTPYESRIVISLISLAVSEQY